MKAMNQQAFKRLAASALMVVLAGCMAHSPIANTPPGHPASDLARMTAGAAGHGEVAVAVHWPQPPSGYGVQAIPYRASRAVITFLDANKQFPQDVSGQVVSPITLNRTSQNSSFYTDRKVFSAQASMSILAEVFEGTASTPIGSASRVVDIVPGLESYVSLDVLVPGAPKIDSATPTTVGVGETITLNGAAFGKTKSWPVEAYLFYQRTYDSPFGPQESTWYSSGRLPATAIERLSDEQVRVTIPEFLDSLSIVDRFPEYFQQGDAGKLMLRLMVDGLNSNPVEIAMPKVSSASANVALLPGTDAPAHGASGPTLINFVNSPYFLPRLVGTEWRYTSSDNFSGSGTLTAKINGGSYLDVSRSYSNGPSYTSSIYLDSTGGYYGEIGFLARIEGSAIQSLPLEPYVLPDGKAATASHFFYNAVLEYPTRTVARDVWAVPGVGVVRVRDISVEQRYPWQPGSFERRTQEFHLTSFKLPASPAPSPSPSPSPSPYSTPASTASATPYPTPSTTPYSSPYPTTAPASGSAS